MIIAKIVSMCAATAITAGAIVVMAPHASAAQHPNLVVTAPADADLVVRHVSYADLNLTMDRGVQVLNHRVGSAVSSVCIEAVGPDTHSLGSTIANMRCTRSAWNGARPQIARAVQRARDIAATGSSTIAASAIVISISE